MPTNTNTTHTRSYGLLAAILAILLVLVLFLWVNARNDLRAVTDKFQGNVSIYSRELIQNCKLTATTTAVQRTECERAFEGLGSTLKEYGKSLVTITSTSTEELFQATTTPTSTPTSTTPTTTTTPRTPVTY
jgi:hypothetical protein